MYYIFPFHLYMKFHDYYSHKVSEEDGGRINTVWVQVVEKEIGSLMGFFAIILFFPCKKTLFF